MWPVKNNFKKRNSSILKLQYNYAFAFSPICLKSKTKINKLDRGKRLRPFLADFHAFLYLVENISKRYEN